MFFTYKLKKQIIRSKFLNFILFSFWRFWNRSARTDIINRSSILIDNFKELSIPIKRCPVENVMDNEMYGIANALKKYANFKGKLNYFIEHGVYFGSIIHQFERDHFIPNLIVPSLIRKKYIENKIEKKVLVTGPYIHYAEDYYNEQQYKIAKEKYGKVLLIFPTHSIKKIEATYNIHEFIEEIEEKKANFNTVIVCLYWKDIELGKAELYLEKGYTVVTAGHMYDPNFLSRLKTIIKLSDYTMANDVGTHLGYCIYLNKPHQVFYQKIGYVTKENNYLEYENSIRNDFDNLTQEKEIQELLEVFRPYSSIITKEQMFIANKYWGIDCIKTPEELKNLLINQINY